MARFSKGDHVAWSHEEATKHAARSILRCGALPAGTPMGKVVEAANAEETQFTVIFDKEHHKNAQFTGAKGTHADKDKLTLGHEELVKIEEEGE